MPAKSKPVIRDTPKLSVIKNLKGQVMIVSHPEADLFRNDSST